MEIHLYTTDLFGPFLGTVCGYMSQIQNLYYQIVSTALRLDTVFVLKRKPVKKEVNPKVSLHHHVLHGPFINIYSKTWMVHASWLVL